MKEVLIGKRWCPAKIGMKLLEFQTWKFSSGFYFRLNHHAPSTICLLSTDFGMGILGIGLDILRVARIKSLVDRRGALPFARRVLSPCEMADWTSNGDNLFLAVR